MKTTFCLLAASALAVSLTPVVAWTVHAQEAQARTDGNAQANNQASARGGNQAQGPLAAGMAINAELDRSLDSKKAKVGDAVTARTTEAIKEDGKVVIPKGTKLAGRVIRASARSRGDSDSTLGLQFDRAELKSGQEMALQVNIQAMSAPPGVTPIGGDDLQGMGNGQPSAGTSNRGAMSGPVGGAASGAASTVPRTTESATGAVNSTVNSTTNAAGGVAGRAGATATGGLNTSGQLAANSRGVFGLGGLTLSSEASDGASGAVIVSSGKSVRLDSGTRLLLVAQVTTAASAQR